MTKNEQQDAKKLQISELPNTVRSTMKVENKNVESTKVILPFLGAKIPEEILSAESFQYLLLGIDSHKAQIALPPWLVNKTQLQKDDCVELHIYFLQDDYVLHRGLVKESNTQDERYGSTYTIEFIHKEKIDDLASEPQVLFKTDSSGAYRTDFKKDAKRILLDAIRDSLFIKRGMLTYFSHLTPYLTRITDYDHNQFPVLKDVLFQDVYFNLKSTASQLDALLVTLSDPSFKISEIALYFDLSELQKMIDSQIYFDIFSNTFMEQSPLPYFRAMKDLDGALSRHFNTIMAVYSHYL